MLMPAGTNVNVGEAFCEEYRGAGIWAYDERICLQINLDAQEKIAERT